MTLQSGAGHLYKLLFDGLADDSPETLQRLKGVFIADLDLSIPEVQTILNQAGSQICESTDPDELLTKSKKLKAAGALVQLVGFEDIESSEESSAHSSEENNSDWEDELDSQEEVELELEIDFEQLERKKTKNVRKTVHVVSEDLSLDDTLKELGLDHQPDRKTDESSKINTLVSDDASIQDQANKPLFNLETSEIQKAPEVNNNQDVNINNNQNLPLFEFDEHSNVNTESELPLDTQAKESDQRPLFDDLTLQDVTETLALNDGLGFVDLEQGPEEHLEPEPEPEQELENEVLQANTEEQDLKQDSPLKESDFSANRLDEEVKITFDSDATIENTTPPCDPLPVSTFGFIETKDEVVDLSVDESMLPSASTSNTSAAQEVTNLNDSAITKTSSDDDWSTAEVVVLKKLPKKSIASKIPWDIFLPILVGATVLGIGNYFYFNGTNNFNELEKARIAKAVKEAVLEAKESKSKKTETINSSLTPNITIKSSSVSDITLTWKAIEIEKFPILKGVELSVAAPPALTEQEIISGKIPVAWLRKINFADLFLQLDTAGNFDLVTSARAYIVDQKTSQRYPTTARLSGRYDEAAKEMKLKIALGDYTNLKAAGYFIERKSAEELLFGLLAEFELVIGKLG